LKSGLIAVWVPFLAADLGNFFGGGVSGYLIRRGWPLGAARKALVVFGGVGVLLLIPTIFTVNLYLIALLFGLATFSYASFSTIANVLPTDLYRSDSVASVSGLSGTGAGIGTIIAFELIGHLSDARQAAGTHSFDPIVIVAGLIPFVGMMLVLLLVRNTRATDEGLVRRISTEPRDSAANLCRTAAKRFHGAGGRETPRCPQRGSSRDRHTHCRRQGS